MRTISESDVEVGKGTVRMPSPEPRRREVVKWRSVARYVAAAIALIAVYSLGNMRGERRADARYSALVDDVAQRDQRLIDTMNNRHAELTKRLDEAVAAQTQEIESRIATLRTSGEELKRATAVLIKESSDESLNARFTRWVGRQTIATWRESFDAYRTAALNHYFPARPGTSVPVVAEKPGEPTSESYTRSRRGPVLGQITVGQ